MVLTTTVTVLSGTSQRARERGEGKADTATVGREGGRDGWMALERQSRGGGGVKDTDRARDQGDSERKGHNAKERAGERRGGGHRPS